MDLKLIHDHLSDERIVMIGDSQLVINQMFGRWRSKGLGDFSRRAAPGFRGAATRSIPRTTSSREAVCSFAASRSKTCCARFGNCPAPGRAKDFTIAE
jgi:hypothetical protein